MPSKVCKVCESKKPIDEFSRDKRNRDGLQHRCKACDSERKKELIQCDNCKAMISRGRLSSHQTTERCKEGDKPWKQFPSYGEAGKKIVKCPCKHWQCRKYITAAQAFRHLKYRELFKGSREEYIKAQKKVGVSDERITMMLRDQGARQRPPNFSDEERDL